MVWIPDRRPELAFQCSQQSMHPDILAVMNNNWKLRNVIMPFLKLHDSTYKLPFRIMHALLIWCIANAGLQMHSGML